jgi:hypothetical protein
MDYRLRRNPDGSVNAMPGDAVEYCSGDNWVPAVFCQPLTEFDGNDSVIVKSVQGGFTYDIEVSRLRHARGGAGWHRLREARLRATWEEMGRLYGYMPDEANDYAKRVLADLDNAEPEA